MIILIIILAFFLRLINLNQSLWLDEGAQVVMSQNSLHSIIFERAGDFHPPLSYILYHFWLLMGYSEIWLRLLPIIFGLATVFIIFKLTNELFNRKVALVSAFFLAIAPFHIYYSQEIRMYAMATFFASLSMYCLVTRKKLGYVLSTSALFYTHYMGIFLIAAQFLYKKNWKDLGLVFLTILPWLPFMRMQLENGVKADVYLPGWGSLLSLNPLIAIPLTFVKFSIGRINFENQTFYAVISGIVLIFFSFIIFQAIKTKGTKLLVYWLLVPMLLTFIISFILPMNQPFRLLFVLPAFYILLAKGVLQMKKRSWIFFVGIVLISFMGIFVYWENPEFQREDWKGATKFIDKVQKDDVVIFAWPTPFDPYSWYGGKGVGVVNQFPAKKEDVLSNITQINSKNIYLFEYLQYLSDPDRNIQQVLLENGYYMDQVYNFNGVGTIDRYTKQEELVQ